MNLLSVAAVKHIALTSLAAVGATRLPTQTPDMKDISTYKRGELGRKDLATTLPSASHPAPSVPIKAPLPCRITMTSPAFDQLFTHGTMREFYDYATLERNISSIDIEAGRARVELGPITLQSDANVSAISIYGDANRYVLNNCTSFNQQTAAFMFMGPAADAMASFLESRPYGDSLWFSGETANRRIVCRDSACLVQSWDWPGRCHDSISLVCPPQSEAVDPNAYVLADAIKVFSTGRYTLVNTEVAGVEPYVLASNATYTASPGCYMGCYTRSGLGLHQVARGVWLAGQVRVPGEYDRGICQPRDLGSHAQACDAFEACALSPCWLGGDTGGWFNLPRGDHIGND